MKENLEHDKSGGCVAPPRSSNRICGKPKERTKEFLGVVETRTTMS
jgi:hypothetical protein